MSPRPGYIMDEELLGETGISLQKLRDNEQLMLPPDKVSRRLVLSLRHWAGTGIVFRHWMRMVTGVGDWEEDTYVTSEVLQRSVSDMKRKIFALQGRRKVNDITAYLHEPFVLPEIRVTTRVHRLKEARAQAINAAHVAHEHRMEAETDAARAENGEHRSNSVIITLQTQLRKSGIEHRTVLREMTFVKEKNGKLTADLQETRRKLRMMEGRMEKGEEKIVRKSVLLKRSRSDGDRRRDQFDDKCIDVDKLSAQLAEARRKVVSLGRELQQRDQIIDTLLEHCRDCGNPTISEKVGRQYAPEMRLLCLRLIEAKVPHAKISHVIRSVMTAVGVTVASVPADRTVRRIAVEGLALAQAHVADVIVHSAGPLTVQTDETTKYGSQFLATAVRTAQGESMMLGLGEMSNKSAQTTLDLLLAKLADLERAGGGEGVSGIILQKIRTAMSDRAATEVKFCSLLQNHKENVVPAMIGNWHEMTEEERKECTTVDGFFCSLHLLANIADVVSEACFQHEIGVADASTLGSVAAKVGFAQQGEPGVFRLVRTVAKCLSRRGSEHGLSRQWKQFLLNKGVSLPGFLPFKGNRFNVVFVDAEISFVSLPLIIEFLETHADNQLHRAVLADVKERLFIAELKVLALFGKLITGPLWRLVETDMHVLDMNGYLSTLVNWLDAAAADPCAFLIGESTPFGEGLVAKDELFQKIVIPSPGIDEACAPIATLLLSSVSALIKRMCKDQLPGGRYHEPSDALRASVQSCPLHNKAPEAIFGFLDNLMTYRPNAGLIVNEALIMMVKNKTLNWIDDKSVTERSELMQKAFSDCQKLRASYALRAQTLQNELAAKLRERGDARRLQLMRATADRAKITVDIVNDGLWQSVEEIDARLSMIPSDDRLAAIKRQLSFRRKVLLQPPPQGQKGSFYFYSVKRVALTVQQLRDKLCLLVIDSLRVPVEPDNRDLVGRRISHRFLGPDGRTEWHVGRVIATVPGFSSWYNTVYLSDPDVVYTFRLGDDLQTGDLTVFRPADC